MSLFLVLVAAVLLLASVPLATRLLGHRLGNATFWRFVWLPLGCLGALSLIAPSRLLAVAGAGIYLLGALLLAASGPVRLRAAIRDVVAVTEHRGWWFAGQAAIGVGLAGPAVAGIALLVRSVTTPMLPIDVTATAVVAAMLGMFVVGVLGGDLALASPDGPGRAATGAVALSVAVSLLGVVSLLGDDAVALTLALLAAVVAVALAVLAGTIAAALRPRAVPTRGLFSLGAAAVGLACAVVVTLAAGAGAVVAPDHARTALAVLAAVDALALAHTATAWSSAIAAAASSHSTGGHDCSGCGNCHDEPGLGPTGDAADLTGREDAHAPRGI